MQATWHKNLEHQGVQISFDGKPSEEIRAKLKKAGFRWSGRQKIWYAKGFYGYASVVAAELATYGGEIGEPLSIEEQVSQKLERADARAERYEARAEKAKAEGESLINQAHKMADVIPFGQPILVGHYSEKGDRNYRDRIHNKFGKGFETLKKAEYYEDRAETASKAEARLFNPGTVMRRIEKLEAQWRKHGRYIEDKIKYKEMGISNGIISREYAEGLEHIMERLEHEIAYWKKALEDQGVTIWRPEDFKKGDKIKTRFGSAEVLKVNKKTVKVKFLRYADDAWEQRADFSKVPFDELPQDCKMEA